MEFRIATWNVERPNEKESNKQKVASLRDQLKSINADNQSKSVK
jgi:hypothetical protein